jgi:hypothetical protein
MAVAIVRREQAKTGEAGRKARAVRADARARELAPVILELRRAGVTTLHAVAAALNARGLSTPTGRGTWNASQVGRVLARLKHASNAER